MLLSVQVLELFHAHNLNRIIFIYLVFLLKWNSSISSNDIPVHTTVMVCWIGRKYCVINERGCLGFIWIAKNTDPLGYPFKKPKHIVLEWIYTLSPTPRKTYIKTFSLPLLWSHLKIYTGQWSETGKICRKI